MQTNGPESLYRRLQAHLDRMPVGFPATESGVELRILQRLFTPEEAALALDVSAIPEPASVIRKRIHPHPPLDELESRLRQMADKGLLLALPGRGATRYSKLIFAVGMYERQSRNLTPEFERDSRQYMDEAFHRAFHTGKTPQLRIVPVNRQIAVERSVTTYDQLRQYIETTSGPFGVIRCICRHGRDLSGDPCRQTKLRDNCLMIGAAATWAADSGTGRLIAREEMLDLLDQADREGLVLQPENTKAPLFVCCCCGCCCGVLTSAKRLPTPAAYFSSNFTVTADPDRCESCGVCETRCQMDAITSPEGKATVDSSRCIGCALCLTTCPSGALQLTPNPHPKIPPDDTKALYLTLLQDRYGPLTLLNIGLRAKLGLKV